MCQQTIFDTETLFTDERISNLSALHRKYLRDKLRWAIAQVQTIHQEVAAYDPTLTSNWGPFVNSTVLFLTCQP